MWKSYEPMRPSLISFLSNSARFGCLMDTIWTPHHVIEFMC